MSQRTNDNTSTSHKVFSKHLLLLHEAVKGELNVLHDSSAATVWDEEPKPESGTLIYSTRLKYNSCVVVHMFPALFASGTSISAGSAVHFLTQGCADWKWRAPLNMGVPAPLAVFFVLS